MGLQNKSITRKASVLPTWSPSPPHPVTSVLQVLVAAFQLSIRCLREPSTFPVSSFVFLMIRKLRTFAPLSPVCLPLNSRVCTVGILKSKEKKTLVFWMEFVRSRRERRSGVLLRLPKICSLMPGNSCCQMNRNGMFSDELSEKCFPNLSAVLPRDV